MKTIWPILSICLTLLACNAQNPKNPGSSVYASPADNRETDPQNEDYKIFDRVRIVDYQGFSEPAYAGSLLIPDGWKSEGRVTWVFDQQRKMGNGTYMTFNAASPDGKYQFDIFAPMSYMWSDNPQLNEMSRLSHNPEYVQSAPPMNSEELLRNALLKGQYRGARIKTVTDARDVASEMMRENRDKVRELDQYGNGSTAYVASAIRADLQMPDGKSAILLLAASNLTTITYNQYNGSPTTLYQTFAGPHILLRYDARDKEEAEQIFSVIMSSKRINPAWKNAVEDFWKSIRQQEHVAHLEKIRIMDAQTRAIAEATIQRGNERLRQLDSQLKTWESSPSNNEKSHSDFIKTIREVETYRDESGTFELSSGYNHAWSRNDGQSYILTNSPNFDPSSTFRDQQWKEMQLVR